VGATRFHGKNASFLGWGCFFLLLMRVIFFATDARIFLDVVGWAQHDFTERMPAFLVGYVFFVVDACYFFATDSRIFLEVLGWAQHDFTERMRAFLIGGVFFVVDACYFFCHVCTDFFGRAWVGATRFHGENAGILDWGCFF
jgi:hypothetical protein